MRNFTRPGRMRIAIVPLVLLCLFVAAAASAPAARAVDLVAPGADWKYLDDGTDLSFDRQLNDESTGMVSRGPYLQMGTPTAVTVRWRTLEAEDSRVSYGPSPASLDQFADDPALTTEHEVRLTGLDPATRYYYAVGSTAEIHAGGDTEHFFQTSPPADTAPPLRAWLLGDSGTANENSAAVRDAYYAFTGTTHTDLWLMLGDNAYASGSDADYQAAVYDMYPEMLRKSVLWPTRGNHERDESVYYDQFTMPTAGEAGGLPSGTEAWYAFDFANIHFVCLDTTGSSLDPGSPMLTWLAGDLAATAQTWIVTFLHHPPYSKGTHNSDNIADSDGRLVQVRENVLPLLEDAGVDLVFAGHSHSYERSYLLDGHYGYSPTLDPSMILDGGDGQLDGTGAYTKLTAPHQGTVYCVAGSAGGSAGGSLDHPAMYASLNVMGSVVLDVDGSRLDMRFLDSSGVVRDHFTMFTGPVMTETVGALFTCIPGSGTLPFSTAMGVTLQNLYSGLPRTVAAAIDVDLASGQHYASWRSGYTNVTGDGESITYWVQSMPALGSLIGPNSFTLRAEDVTAPPWNQPPYPPAGDTATAGCGVTGVSP